MFSPLQAQGNRPPPNASQWLIVQTVPRVTFLEHASGHVLALSNISPPRGSCVVAFLGGLLLRLPSCHPCCACRPVPRVVFPVALSFAIGREPFMLADHSLTADSGETTNSGTSFTAHHIYIHFTTAYLPWQTQSIIWLLTPKTSRTTICTTSEHLSRSLPRQPTSLLILSEKSAASIDMWQLCIQMPGRHASAMRPPSHRALLASATSPS